MKKVRLIERVPEEEHEVVYIRRIDIDNRIAPESVTCFQDVWMAENDRITSRKTYFIAQKAPCKEVKADSFLNKECFVLPPVNYTCFYGSTGMESVETVINGGVLSTPTHKLTVNGTTWYRYLETPAEVSRIHVSKVTDTSTLKWCIKVENPQEFFGAISTEDFITDRVDEESLTVLSEHADNGTPFTLCLVNNQSYEEGILHTSTVTPPETEEEIDQAGNALLNIGIPYFLITKEERRRLKNYTSDTQHFADVVLANGERCPLSLRNTSGNYYILVFLTSNQEESFYKMMRYGFTCVKAGDETVRCKAFILKKAYEEEMNAPRFRIPSKEKVYEITPITDSSDVDELDVLTPSAERYVWSDAILRRPKTEPDEIFFSPEEQDKTFSMIEGGRIERFRYPDERIQSKTGSYTSTMSSRELKLVSKYVGSYNYVQNSSLNGMDEDHVEERTWYKVYRTDKPTSQDWVKAVQFLENTSEI